MKVSSLTLGRLILLYFVMPTIVNADSSFTTLSRTLELSADECCCKHRLNQQMMQINEIMEFMDPTEFSNWDTIPAIVDWNNSHTNDQTLAFLVNQGEGITFSITVSGQPDGYVWMVNGINQNNNSPNFTFNTPAQENIWRISAEVIFEDTSTAEGTNGYEDISIELNFPDLLTWIIATTKTGTATVYYSGAQDRIQVENGWTNLYSIDSVLNDTSLIEEVFSGIWLLKKTINISSSAQLYINNIDTDELRLLGEDVDASINSYSLTSINGVDIKSWNRITGTYEDNSYGSNRPSIVYYAPGIFEHNIIIGLSNALYLYDVDSSVYVMNNDITESWRGIILYKCSNTTVRSNIISTYLGCITADDTCNYISIIANNIGSPPEGGGALSLSRGIKNNVSYNVVTSSGWNGIAMSATELSYAGHNEVYGNFAGSIYHNGMDWHGAKNSIAEYNYLHGNGVGDNGYYIDGSTVELYNITFRHNVVEDISSRGMAIDNGHDCTIIDLISRNNSADGLQFYASPGYNYHTAGNWHIINSSIYNNGGNGVDLDRIWGFYRVVNMYVSGHTGGDCTGQDYCLDSSSWPSYDPSLYLINSGSTRVGWIGANNSGTLRVYYYLDVNIIDADSTPLEDAEVTVTNLDNPAYPPINMIDTFPPTNISTSYTGPDGHTPLPSNKSETFAVMDYLETISGDEQYTYKIKVSYQGFSDSILGVNPDTLWYRTNPDSYPGIPEKGTITITLPVGISEESGENLPKAYVLFHNYPNPFHSTTQIKYALPKQIKVEISIYNVLGEKVKVLVNESQNSGYYEICWDGKDFRNQECPIGIYFCRFETGNYSAIKKLLLVR